VEKDKSESFAFFLFVCLALIKKGCNKIAFLPSPTSATSWNLIFHMLEKTHFLNFLWECIKPFYNISKTFFD